MEQPLREIVANAGDEPSVVVDKGPARQGQLRLQRLHRRVRRHGRDGRPGPHQVTRTALQNAASVAGLMLTTECMVAELAEDKPAMPRWATWVAWAAWAAWACKCRPDLPVRSSAPPCAGRFLFPARAWLFRRPLVLVFVTLSKLFVSTNA